MVATPPVVIDSFIPCQLSTDVPRWMNQYPAYVSGLALAVQQCNERNAIVSEHNQRLVAGTAA